MKMFFVYSTYDSIQIETVWVEGPPTSQYKTVSYTNLNGVTETTFGEVGVNLFQNYNDAAIAANIMRNELIKKLEEYIANLKTQYRQIENDISPN